MPPPFWQGASAKSFVYFSSSETAGIALKVAKKPQIVSLNCKLQLLLKAKCKINNLSQCKTSTLVKIMMLITLWVKRPWPITVNWQWRGANVSDENITRPVAEARRQQWQNKQREDSDGRRVVGWLSGCSMVLK